MALQALGGFPRRLLLQADQFISCASWASSFAITSPNSADGMKAGRTPSFSAARAKSWLSAV